MASGFRKLFALRRSLLAFVITLALGLLSMGALGSLLYYPLYPVLAPVWGSPSDWHGDWVWPTLIIAGMGWSPSFLVAGVLAGRLSGYPAWLRRIAYVGVLWSGALAVWTVLLLAR